MQSDETHLILISGPAGVGKTSVGQELSGLLEAESIAHMFVDLDGLAHIYPRPQEDPFGSAMALKNLQSVWQNARATGIRNLIIARVIETQAGADRIARTVGAPESKIVELMADDSVLLDRVRKRETGSARAWHEKRALELSGRLRQQALGDLVIDTSETSIRQAAHRIMASCNWV